jgi:type II restriction enzyme
MLKGNNKGEWSELYVFFQLLADGKLHSADEHLNKTESFVELLSIYRKDDGQKLNFNIVIDGNINIIDSKTEEVIFSFPQSEAREVSKNLVKEINGKTGISQSLKDTILSYRVTKVADKSLGKGDIDVRIYDPMHGISSNQEFSIKSFLGSDPTLFNANKTTNIKYKITNSNSEPIGEEDLKEINSINRGHKYIKRIAKLIELGYEINFHSYDDDTFKLNLQVICTDLPEIIAHIVKDKYVSKVTKWTDIIDKITKDNPLNYDQSQGHKFYENRLVSFLVEAALGMTSKAVWSGNYDIVGGIIIVKPNAEVLCYHLIDFNKFKHYLRKSARFDNPSGSKMGYGEVYFQGNESFIKLNFQVKA